MPLKCTRNPGESVKDMLTRYAEPYGLEIEVMEAYADALSGRIDGDEDLAAWEALYEWDLLDYISDEEAVKIMQEDKPQ